MRKTNDHLREFFHLNKIEDPDPDPDPLKQKNTRRLYSCLSILHDNKFY